MPVVRSNSPDGKRSHMTAFVSDDDGALWKGRLLLDERESSYPDGIQAEDGTLLTIYDHQRYTLTCAGKRGWLRANCRIPRRRRSREQASHGRGTPSPGRDTTSGYGRHVRSTVKMKTQLITAVAEKRDPIDPPPLVFSVKLCDRPGGQRINRLQDCAQRTASQRNRNFRHAKESVQSGRGKGEMQSTHSISNESDTDTSEWKSKWPTNRDSMGF